MTLVVVGQTGLIGNGLIRKNCHDYIDFTIRNWNLKSFQNVFKNNLLKGSVKNSLDIVWAAGVSNNSSPKEVIDQEIELVVSSLTQISSLRSMIRSLNYISSAGSIYSNLESSYIDEDTKLSPASDYGRSRIVIENLFQECASKIEVRMNIFRLTNVFGQNMILRKNSGLINHLIKANLQRKELNIFVPLQVEQDYIDLDFVVMNLINIINNKPDSRLNSNIYNLSRNQSNSVIELVKLIDKLMGRKTPYVMVKTDSTKMRQFNLKFRFNNDSYLSHKIQPIHYSIKKLINEMVYEKIT